MIDRHLAPGYKIEMRHAPQFTLKEKQPSKVHISQIYDVLDDDRIEVMMPIEQSKLILLPLKAVYTLVVYTETGVYQCDAKVVDQYKKDSIYLLAMEIITKVKRYQRREYYRYGCTLPVFTRQLTEEEMAKRIWDVNKEGKEGVMLDLGGGGIRFVTKEEYQPDTMILCCFCLDFEGTEQEYQIAGKVLSTTITGKNDDKYEVRVQFEDVTNLTREEIIQFIFEDERRQKRGRRR
ncbi:MAG: flagellar brake protein [Lachnospiraceae bacterium]|nr:flagellar brake protein [Lachnospiraceae bacterium]MDY5701031.1 flagellar brake protein [Lachnospiraceae bacterium]